MTAATVPVVYADAAWELAEERDALAALVADAATLRTVLAEHPELKHFLAGTQIKREAVEALLQSIFAGRVHALTLDLLGLLVRRDRIDELDEILAAVGERHDRAIGRRTVRVQTAVALDQATRAALEKRLRARLGEAIEVVYASDPALIGGMVLTYDGCRVDGSARRHLDELGRRIRAIPIAGLWSETGMSKSKG